MAMATATTKQRNERMTRFDLGENSMEIPFTQYLRPDGRKKEIWLEVYDREIFEIAQAVIAAGVVFEAEVLTTGQVALAAEKVNYADDEIPTVAIEICENAPGSSRGAAERLIRKAAAEVGIRGMNQ